MSKQATITGPETNTLEDLRKARKYNEERFKDMRQAVENEKLMYELNHYKLLSRLDFLESERIREEFLEKQQIALDRIKAEQAAMYPDLGEVSSPIEGQEEAAEITTS